MGVVAMATVTLDKIDQVYPNGFHAATGSATCRQEFLVLVGPSGCGKSTAADDRRAEEI